MAFLGLLFKTRVRIGVDAGAEILPFGAVELDASIEETHRSAVTITQFPVEEGVDISDHVRKQPDRVVIRGIVTDHPLTFGGAFRSGRSLDALGNFLFMLNAAEIITLVTSLSTYTSMILESIEMPRNPQRSSAVEFVLTLREILTASVAVAAGTTDLGTQNGTPLGPL